MASPAKLAAASAFLAGWLLFMAAAYTIRIRHNPRDRPEWVADAVESTKTRNQSLWGAAIFAVIAVGCLIAWAL